MEAYYGTKAVNAKPMTRQEYNDFRGWELPSDEDGSDEGYLVEYVDGGEANTKDFDGYVSWSPKYVFEHAYDPVSKMSFSHALEALKEGYKVARVGWNGKNMWLKIVPLDIAEKISWEYAALNPLPWIGMKTATEEFVPWLASQTDMLAEDWMIVDV